MIQKDYDLVKLSVHNVLKKTDYNTEVTHDSKTSTTIEFNKFMQGKGEFTVKKMNNQDNTYVRINFSKNFFNNTTWIFEQALLQEIAQRDNPAFKIRSNLKRKSLLTYCLLNTLSPAFAGPYLFHNNPYFNFFEGCFITVSYGAIDAMCIYFILNPSVSKDLKNYGYFWFCTSRILFYIMGFSSIPDYNSLVDSGYHFEEKRPIEESINLPAFYKRI